MRDPLVAKVYPSSKTSVRETRGQSKDAILWWTDSERESLQLASYKTTNPKTIDSKAFLHDLEYEVPPSIKKEFTSSDGSPRMRKFRAQTQSLASEKDSAKNSISKSQTGNLINFKALAENLEYEVSLSIKKELISSSAKGRSPCVEINRNTSNQITSNSKLTNHSLIKFTASCENLNEVFSSIKQEPTSPERIEMRYSSVKSEGQTTTPAITKRRRENLNPTNLTASFENLNQVFSSIKKEPTSPVNVAVRYSRVKTEGRTTTPAKTKRRRENLNPTNLTASSENLNQVFFSTKKETTSPVSTAVRYSRVKTEGQTTTPAKTKRKRGNLNNPTNFTASSENLNQVFSSIKKEPKSPRSRAVRYSRVKTEAQTITPAKTKRRRKNFKESPPTTPYALNRPQRTRFPPLAFWRGEHRPFRILSSGEIIFFPLLIPIDSEEPRKKKRRLS